jgi:hypothetical protein
VRLWLILSYDLTDLSDDFFEAVLAALFDSDFLDWVFDVDSDSFDLLCLFESFDLFA